MKTFRAFLVGVLLCTLFLATPSGQDSIIRLTGDGWLVAPGNAVPLLLGSNGKGFIKISETGVITFINSAATTFLAADGSAVAPSYSFTNYPTTGWYATAGPVLQASVNGTRWLQLDSAGTFYLNSASASINLGASPGDTIVAREAAGHWFFRNSTTAQRLSVANTYTSTTNYESFSVDWQTTANNAIVGTRTAATGTARPMQLVSQVGNGVSTFAAVRINSNALPFLNLGLLDASGAAAGTVTPGTFFTLGSIASTATSGPNVIVNIAPTYNQTSGTAANTDLLINRTQTAVGSGTQLLIDAQVGGVSQFSVTNTGSLTTSSVTASSQVNVGATGLKFNNVLSISGTAPTVTSAGTSPSVSGTNTGAFRVNVGTGGAATTIVMSMPAATTGWNCDTTNITASAANRAAVRTVQQASTTTSVTVQNQNVATGAATAFTASDIVSFVCTAF